MGYRNYGAESGFIVDKNGHGDFKTIQSAINASSSGQSIFINPGTYTENLTAKSGVLLTAAPGSGYTNVIINGTITCSTTGYYYLSNIQLQTNSSFLLVVGGSSPVGVAITGCYLNCLNNTGISFTNSSSSSVISIYNTSKNLGSTGVALYSMSSPGSIIILRSDLQNSGLSSTAATNSAGSVSMYNCVMSSVHAVSGSGAFSVSETRLDTSAVNTTCLTASGTSIINAFHSELYAGTAPCVSVGTGCTLTTAHLVASSSATDVFTGAGAWYYAYTAFLGSSHGHNVTTETALSTF